MTLRLLKGLLLLFFFFLYVNYSQSSYRKKNPVQLGQSFLEDTRFYTVV